MPEFYGRDDYRKHPNVFVDYVRLYLDRTALTVKTIAIETYPIYAMQANVSVMTQ